jgi:hypothetical protein
MKHTVCYTVYDVKYLFQLDDLTHLSRPISALEGCTLACDAYTSKVPPVLCFTETTTSTRFRTFSAFALFILSLLPHFAYRRRPPG